MNLPTPNPFIKWFAEFRIAEMPLVGGRNTSLDELFQELTPKGVQVPRWLCGHRRRIASRSQTGNRHRL